jgi:hypothetical protein
MELVLVTVGGVTVTCGQAAAAMEVLAGSRTSAIAPVLRAARSPLASCDYFTAAAPYLAWARSRPKTGRAGAAGRHVTKEAFCRAVRRAMDDAASARVASAMRCMRADERYAAQIAADAVEVRRRNHAASVRSAVEAEVAHAVAQCALSGQPCALESACGTGTCRFAPAWLASYDIPAGPGKARRPLPHMEAGAVFSAAPVVAAVLAASPYRPMVTVADADTVSCAEFAA